MSNPNIYRRTREKKPKYICIFCHRSKSSQIISFLLSYFLAGRERERNFLLVKHTNAGEMEKEKRFNPHAFARTIKANSIYDREPTSKVVPFSIKITNRIMSKC